MVLESTMICVDDSDFMRNGDFVPTRLAAVQDAVNIVCLSKTRSNPENNVGLLTMASSEVLATLTTDVSKLMSKLLAVTPQGDLKLMSGLRVAHLALKHRQGKNHKMRIIVFVGSPLEGLDQGELVRLAKRLKKEKVNVDVVSFGEEKGNQDVLNAFVDALNGKDGTGSHLVVVPPGPNLTDALVASPILQSEDGAPVPGIGAGGYDFGMEGDDPELALALRVSMEEQRARQEAEARSTNPDPAAEGASNEEQMLEQALAMSMDRPGATGRAAGALDFSAMSEEEQIEYAMQMSMQEQAVPAETKGETSTEAAKAGEVKEEAMEVDEAVVEGEEDYSAVMQDTEYLQQVLEGLPSTAKKETTEAAKTLAQKGSSSSKTSASSTAKKSPEDPKKKPDPKAGSGSSQKKK